MKSQIIAIQDLTAEQHTLWRQFQQENQNLASPYFSVEFADALSAVRRDSSVLAIVQNGTIRGFLPMHMSVSGFIRPLGGPMGDHQAIITDDDALDPHEALAAAGIDVYAFNGGLASQALFRDAGRETEESWVIDLSGGYDSYVAGKKKSLSRILSCQRKLDRLDEEVVFRVDDRRQDVFEAALRMKREQYRATGATDVFAASWSSTLIRLLFEQRRPEFAGCLSTLEIGGKLAAAHFGIRSPSVLHYWFPVYDPQFARLKPGLVLLLEMARHMSADGLQQIHLGPGDHDYKTRMGNHSFTLSSGEWHRPSFAASVLKAGRSIDALTRRLPLGPVSLWPAKALRRLDKISAVHGI